MVSSINYVKVKRDKHGICNICGKTDVLTWDHVPPKKAIYFNSVEIISMLNKYSEENPHGSYSQNGTKYRTICKNCNNDLGTYYDVSFVEFVHEASQKIYESFPNKEFINCKIKPVKFIKSLFGHLLAAKGEYESSLIDIKMRTFLMDKSLWLPEFNVFYWFNPYPNIEIARDFAICKINSNTEPDVFSMLKMYPVSFYITEEDTFKHLYNLKDYCSSNIDEYVEIPINISIEDLVHPDWPIIFDDDTILLTGQSVNSSVISKPRLLKDIYIK